MSAFNTIFKKLAARVKTLNPQGTVNFDLNNDDDDGLNFFPNNSKNEDVKTAGSSASNKRHSEQSAGTPFTNNTTTTNRDRGEGDRTQPQESSFCTSTNVIAAFQKPCEQNNNNNQVIMKLNKSYDVIVKNKDDKGCTAENCDKEPSHDHAQPKSMQMMQAPVDFKLDDQLTIFGNSAKTKGSIIQWNLPITENEEIMFIDSKGNLVDSEDLTHSAVKIFDTVYEFCVDGVLETPSTAFSSSPGTVVSDFETVRTKEELETWNLSQQCLFRKGKFDPVSLNDIHFCRCMLGFLGVVKQPTEWSSTMYGLQQIFSVNISNLRDLYMNFSGRSLNAEPNIFLKLQ